MLTPTLTYPATEVEGEILQVAREVRGQYPVSRGYCTVASLQIARILEDRGIIVNLQYGWCVDRLSQAWMAHTWVEVWFRDLDETWVLDVTMDQFGYEVEVAWGEYEDFPWLRRAME